MKQHYQCHLYRFQADQQLISYRLYRNKYQPHGRRLVLLHGAGVAGEDTWSHLVTYLSHWSEILVPDLRGMGETRDPDGGETPFKVEEALGDVIALLEYLGWWAVDLGGYSFGGLLSLLFKAQHPARIHKQYLLESALLDRVDITEVVRLRDQYTEAAAMLREAQDPRRGILAFLDTISPNRVPSAKSEQMIIERLAHRAEGFANALDAVTEASRRLDRQVLLDAQQHVSSFIGGRSVEDMHHYHRQLADDREDWRYHSVQGCDHSLPFQKPRQIARQMNEDMALYLERKPITTDF